MKFSSSKNAAPELLPFLTGSYHKNQLQAIGILNFQIMNFPQTKFCRHNISLQEDIDLPDPIPSGCWQQPGMLLQYPVTMNRDTGQTDFFECYLQKVQSDNTHFSIYGEGRKAPGSSSTFCLLNKDLKRAIAPLTAISRPWYAFPFPAFHRQLPGCPYAREHALQHCMQHYRQLVAGSNFVSNFLQYAPLDTITTVISTLFILDRSFLQSERLPKAQYGKDAPITF